MRAAGFYDGSDGGPGQRLTPAELCYTVIEALYHRAQAISMGLDPDTTWDDLQLVEPMIDAEGRHMGARPARSITKEYLRVSRWLDAERKKAQARHGSP